MEKISFAVIGVGRIGARHVEHILKLGELKAVCDINIKKLAEISQLYKCETFQNIDEMLISKNDIDVISVCTPNWLHKEHVIKSLNSGKHVLVEKPMALSVKDCEAMITAAESMNKRLFIVKQNRFNPPIIELKKVIDAGKLGKLLSFQVNCFWNRNEDYYRNSSWKGKKNLDGGTLYTQFSHFIDIIYWLFGDVLEVKSYLSNSNHEGIIEFEDSGVVILKFENGVTGTLNYNVNSYKKNMEGSITVFGEKGTIKVGGEYLNTLEYQNIEGFEIIGLPESKPANNYGNYQGSMSNHDKVYENVINVLSKNEKIMTNFIDGMKTIQIIEKIYKEL